MTCSLCGSIPDVASANTGRDERFGPPITSLKRNDIEPDDDLRECPSCDAVFLWHDYTAQTGSGNNDEETLTRLPPEQAPFVRAFLHRGERGAEDAAQDAARLLQLPDRVRDLLLAHVLVHDRELAARLLPWMLDEIARRDHSWASGFVSRFASRDDAGVVMSELSKRPPHPALEKLRAHCKRVGCSICTSIVSYRRTVVRRDRALPPPLDALVNLRASDDLDLWECPECDSMFLWETKNDDEGSLIGQSEPLASALRACVHRDGIVPAADIETVFACDVPRVVIAYGLRHDRELVRQLAPRMVTTLARFEQPWLRDMLSAFAATDPIADWDSFESALAKMTNEDALRELEGAFENLTTKEAWKDLETVMRKALRLVTGFAGPRIGAREKADVEHDLWRRLGLLYAQRLDSKESALLALEMALRHRPGGDDEIHLALAALHEHAGQIERALRSNETAVRMNPTRTDGYRNLFRMHHGRGDYDAMWCAGATLSFLKHPRQSWEVGFYGRYGSPKTPSATADIDAASWSLLRHEDESDVITGVFRAVAPAAARLARAESRGGSGADRWRSAATGLSPAETAFMAGRNAAYGRDPMGSLIHDHAVVSELEYLFMAALRMVWLDGWVPAPVFEAGAAQEAAKLARFIEPVELASLRVAAMAVRKQGAFDIVKWANGVELTASRAGLLYAGGLVAAESALGHLARERRGGNLGVEKKMGDLLAFGVTETYVGLRKKHDRAINVRDGDIPSDEPADDDEDESAAPLEAPMKEPMNVPDDQMIAMLTALLAPAGPPLTVGALESALGMQLGMDVFPASSMGTLTAANVSAEYMWSPFSGDKVTTLEDLRWRPLFHWSVRFVGGCAAVETALRDRFSPRELPSGRGQVFGSWILAAVAGSEACTLSWYAKLPDWAVPPADAALRERVLVELAAALTTAETIADVASALSSSSSQPGCGLVHDPAKVTERVAYVELVPPIEANELARILGWRDVVGETFEMHMQRWVVRVVTGQGEYALETAFPKIANWGVTATLGGWPTGGQIIHAAPAGGPPAFSRPGGTHRFGPADVVRFIQFGA